MKKLNISQFPHAYSTQGLSYLLSICHLCLVQSVKPKTHLQHNKYEISNK